MFLMLMKDLIIIVTEIIMTNNIIINDRDEFELNQFVEDLQPTLKFEL